MQVLQDISQLKASVCAMQDEQTIRVRKQMKLEVLREILPYLECKICKDVPTPPVLLLVCCGQVLGCETCFETCMEASDLCPLCRATNPTTILINGQDGLYSILKDSERNGLDDDDNRA